MIYRNSLNPSVEFRRQRNVNGPKNKRLKSSSFMKVEWKEDLLSGRETAKGPDSLAECWSTTTNQDIEERKVFASSFFTLIGVKLIKVNLTSIIPNSVHKMSYLSSVHIYRKILLFYFHRINALHIPFIKKCHLFISRNSQPWTG